MGLSEMPYTTQLIVYDWILFSLSGHLNARGEGLLFSNPAISFDKENIEIFSNIKKEGWYVCKYKYAVRAVRWSENEILIFPSLKVSGVSSVSGKTENLSIKTTKEQFDAYIKKLIEIDDGEHRDSFESDLPILVHDIRRLNSVILDYSEGLHNSKPLVHTELNMTIGNIKAASEVISSRLDMANEEDLFSAQVNKIIEPYKVVDKIVRVLRRRAKNRGIKININGNTRCRISGPKSFDNMIYAILDNMEKYSPENNNINVNLSDDGSSFYFETSSLGPHLGEDIEKIFDRGFRSSSAKSSGILGSGIGLYWAQRICAMFSGRIHVSENGRVITRNGIIYSNKEFEFSIPILREF